MSTTATARRVDVWVPLEGEVDDLIETFGYSPSTWLPDPAEGRGPGHWAVTLRAGPVTRAGTCGLGETTGDDSVIRRRLVWHADLETAEDDSQHRALPSFEGTLVLRITDRHADLGIEGSYEPPTGAIGASLSPQQLQAMAETTAANFLREVATSLAERAS